MVPDHYDDTGDDRDKENRPPITNPSQLSEDGDSWLPSSAYISPPSSNTLSEANSTSPQPSSTDPSNPPVTNPSITTPTRPICTAILLEFSDFLKFCKDYENAAKLKEYLSNIKNPRASNLLPALHDLFHHSALITSRSNNVAKSVAYQVRNLHRLARSEKEFGDIIQDCRNPWPSIGIHGFATSTANSGIFEHHTRMYTDTTTIMLDLNTQAIFNVMMLVRLQAFGSPLFVEEGILSPNCWQIEHYDWKQDSRTDFSGTDGWFSSGNWTDPNFNPLAR